MFEVARDLKDRYDNVGFVRLRGLPNEEPLILVGMALYDQKPIPDDGIVKADAMHYTREIRIDVLNGTNYFRGNSKQITSWNVSEVEPVIAHLNDSYAEKIPYIREQAKLRKIYADGASRFWASTHAKLTQSLPYRIVESTKDFLRPAYYSFWDP